MRFIFGCLGTCAVLVFANFAGASEEDGFVTSNLISVVYHELGHAVIDTMQVPIFGQEEDAADVFSMLLIDEIFEPESANIIAYDAAFGFHAEAQENTPAFWDAHGPDEQRYHYLVCIFYGANPDLRKELAQELRLPEECAISCAEEYELAIDSWGGVLQDMEEGTGKLRLMGPSSDPMYSAIRQEIEGFNSIFGFPSDVSVTIEKCGAANAYYDLSEVSITICTEFDAHLRQQFDNL